jgi:hypothetical protein
MHLPPRHCAYVSLVNLNHHVLSSRQLPDAHRHSLRPQVNPPHLNEIRVAGRRGRASIANIVIITDHGLGG